MYAIIFNSIYYYISLFILISNKLKISKSRLP